MEEQRERARIGAARRTARATSTSAWSRSRAMQGSSRDSSATRRPRLNATVEARRRARSDGRVLAKFPESPFYAEGGGQVADSGVVETESGRGRVEDVYRLGDDQAVAIAIEQGELEQGERGRAWSSTGSRDTRPPATTPRRTCCTPLCVSGSARMFARRGRRCARTSCASTSRTGKRARPEDVRAIEDRVNQWILESRPVRALHTTRRRAEELGAMALFGEKYGDEVRMIEVEGVSRELCGGTHVGVTSEIGVFKISRKARARPTCAASKRSPARGPSTLLRERDDAVSAIAARLRTSPERAPAGGHRPGGSAPTGSSGTSAPLGGERSRLRSRSWPRERARSGR